MEGGLWATLGAAGTVVIWAIVTRIRRRLASNKRLIPHVRYRGYFSIRTSEPPKDAEPEAVIIPPPKEGGDDK